MQIKFHLEDGIVYEEDGIPENAAETILKTLEIGKTESITFKTDSGKLWISTKKIILVEFLNPDEATSPDQS